MNIFKDFPVLEDRMTNLEKMVTKLEKEKKELETVLEAWQTAFGSTQLTHALCNYESVKDENIKLKRQIKENEKRRKQ